MIQEKLVEDGLQLFLKVGWYVTFKHNAERLGQCQPNLVHICDIQSEKKRDCKTIGMDVERYDI